MQIPSNLTPLNSDVVGWGAIIEDLLRQFNTRQHAVILCCIGVDGHVPSFRVVEIVVPDLRRQGVYPGTTGIVERMGVRACIDGPDVESVEEISVVDRYRVVCALHKPYARADVVRYLCGAGRNRDFVQARLLINCQFGGGETDCDVGGLLVGPEWGADIEIKAFQRGDCVPKGEIEWIRCIAFNGGDWGADLARSQENMRKAVVAHVSPAVCHKFRVPLWVIYRTTRILWLHAECRCAAAMCSCEEERAIRMTVVLVVYRSPRLVWLREILVSPHIACHHHGHRIVYHQLGKVCVVVDSKGMIQVSH